MACTSSPSGNFGRPREMLSDNAESLIMNLGITVKNTPPFRADWKPLVERYFKLTNERTKSLLPGAVNTDFMQRGGEITGLMRDLI